MGWELSGEVEGPLRLYFVQEHCRVEREEDSPAVIRNMREHSVRSVWRFARSRAAARGVDQRGRVSYLRPALEGLIAETPSSSSLPWRPTISPGSELKAVVF